MIIQNKLLVECAKSLFLLSEQQILLTAPDEGYRDNIFLISPQKHVVWYSLEMPYQGASNEYPQHMYLLRNKKNINNFWLKKKKKEPYLDLCIFCAAG